MVLLLQKKSNGNFVIVMPNLNKNKMYNYDYFIMVDDIKGNTTYQAIMNLVVREFGCEKLIINF